MSAAAPAVFPPPTKALMAGVKLSLALFVPLVAVTVIVGGQATTPAVMGFMAVAVVPFCTRTQAAVLVPALALTGVLSTLAAQTWWAVPVVVAACIAAGLANRISAGAFGIAPVVAAVMTLEQPENSPLVVGLVMLAVSAYVVVVIHLLKFHMNPTPVPWPAAVRHTVVMSVACGGATAIALSFDWPKAYWLVMTLAIVLRPYVGDALLRSKQRVAGTILGAFIAVLLSPLPAGVQVVFAGVCLMLMMAYIVTKNYTMQVAFMTPMIVFLVSSGTVSSTLQMDGLRLLYTATACIVGGMAAVLLARRDVTG